MLFIFRGTTLDSQLLEYFLRVSDLGSINKAAADLHISQPALSRHIANLEQKVGAQLFVRSRGGVRLTDAGRLLADRTRPLLRQLTSIKEEVGEAAAGHLNLGIPPSWQEVFTVEFVQRLSRTYPGVKLRVSEGVSNSVRDQMLAGTLDLCIIPFEPSPPAGFQQTPLVREPLILVGSNHKGLVPSQPQTVASLSALNLILPARPNVLRSQVEHALVRKGLTFKVLVETDSLALCLDLAALDRGFTVVPACSLYRSKMAPSLSWAPVSGMFMTWVLLENEARSHSPTLRRGRSVLLEVVERAVAGSEWFGAERHRNILTTA